MSTRVNAQSDSRTHCNASWQRGSTPITTLNARTVRKHTLTSVDVYEQEETRHTMPVHPFARLDPPSMSEAQSETAVPCVSSFLVRAELRTNLR